jgi:hypothetical protein
MKTKAKKEEKPISYYIVDGLTGLNEFGIDPYADLKLKQKSKKKKK